MEAGGRLGPTLPAEDPEMTSIPWPPLREPLVSKGSCTQCGQGESMGHSTHAPASTRSFQSWELDPRAATFQRLVDLAVASESLGSSDTLVLSLFPRGKDKNFRTCTFKNFR